MSIVQHLVFVQGKQAVLMSVISGDAVSAVRDKEDKEVVDECVKVLRELFKEQVINQSHSADWFWTFT